MSVILVTGGAGYIGSHAVRALVAAGHDVVVVDNLSKGYAAAVDCRATLTKIDVGDTDALAALMQRRSVEAVMHFAAFIEVGESVTDPEKYYSNNFSTGLSLLNAMRIAGVQRLVFSSTAAVYGNPQYTPIDENHPCLPINPYGRAKWMMEQAIEDFSHAYGIGYTCLRYFNVAGASVDASIGEAHQPESHLIPRVLDAAAHSEKTVSVFGSDYDTRDGSCIRDYVHIEDLIQAHLLALAAMTSGKGRVYNLGSETGFSVREVINVCKEITGRPIHVREEARRPGDPATLVAGSARIRKELGWAPLYPDLATIVRHAWAWHQSHPQGYKDATAPVKA